MAPNTTCENFFTSSAAVFWTKYIASVGAWKHSFCLETRLGCKSDAFTRLVVAEKLSIAAGRSIATHQTEITSACHISVYTIEINMDSIHDPENKHLPYAIILFSVVGWILATGSGKAQWVRLVDVLLYGPYLLYLSFQSNYVFSTTEKLFLAFLGATTRTYNLRNYLKV